MGLTDNLMPKSYPITLELILDRANERKQTVWTKIRRIHAGDTGESVFERKDTKQRIKPVAYSDIEMAGKLPMDTGIVQIPMMIVSIVFFFFGINDLFSMLGGKQVSLMSLMLNIMLGVGMFGLVILLKVISNTPINLLRLYSPHPNIYIPLSMAMSGQRIKVKMVMKDVAGNVKTDDNGMPLYEYKDFNIPVIAPLSETDNMWGAERMRRNIMKYTTKSSIEQLQPLGAMIILAILFLAVLYFSTNVFTETIKHQDSLLTSINAAIASLKTGLASGGIQAPAA